LSHRATSHSLRFDCPGTFPDEIRRPAPTAGFVRGWRPCSATAAGLGAATAAAPLRAALCGGLAIRRPDPALAWPRELWITRPEAQESVRGRLLGRRRIAAEGAARSIGSIAICGQGRTADFNRAA